MSPSTDAAPTRRQLRYLRVLAAKTGTTFAYPATRGDASRQIDRLRKLDREPNAAFLQSGGLDAEQLVYATAVHASEVSRFGSSATWRAGSRTPPPPGLPRTPVGEPTELARYTVSCGERVLHGQRMDGCLRVTDRPGSSTGRSYLVEGDLELDDQEALEALVADYLERARELDDVPMTSSAVRQLFAQAGSHA